MNIGYRFGEMSSLGARVRMSCQGNKKWGAIMGMRGKRLLACVAAVAGLTLLAGCGSGGGPSGALGQAAAPKINNVADLSSAITSTTDQKNSAKVVMTMDDKASGASGTITATGVIQMNPAAGDITMTLKTSGTGADDVASGQFEIIVLDSTFYMKLPDALAQALAQESGNTDAATKPWIKIDPNGTDSLSQMLAPMVTSTQEDNNPASAISKLKSAGTLTSTLHEQLNGQSTTHYTINVDLAKMAASLPDSDPDKEGITDALDNGASTETVDLWVNDQELPVQIIVKNAESTAAITYSDWGTPVNITAPPADQVTVLPGN
ncbi:MAG TPA: hypothetical protein VF444_01755 [Pseudonocardiaceae bacterium]